MAGSHCRSFGRVIGSLLLFAGALFLGGCDTGSKRASLYQRLTGTWRVERLQGVGDFEINYTDRLERRYSRVRFVFRSGHDGRTYRVTGRLSGDTTVVLAKGPIVLRRNRMLYMTRGFETPGGMPRTVTWRYRFQASRAILRLPSDQRNGSRAFLSTLFPRTSWSGSQGVRLQLAPTEK